MVNGPFFSLFIAVCHPHSWAALKTPVHCLNKRAHVPYASVLSSLDDYRNICEISSHPLLPLNDRATPTSRWHAYCHQKQKNSFTNQSCFWLPSPGSGIVSSSSNFKMIKYDWRKTDAHFGSAVLLGFSALLLLFTCLSAPVVETVYLYRISLKLNTVSTRYVDVGLWGYCVEKVKGCVLSYVIAWVLTYPWALVLLSIPFNDPNVVEGCSASRVGFSLDNNAATALCAYF